MKRRGIGTGALLGTVVLALLLLTAGSVSALEERTGQTVVIEAGEVINDDLVVAAETFVLNGTVKGDIMATGGSMTIGPTGVVEGDLMAAGRDVVIPGNREGRRAHRGCSPQSRQQRAHRRRSDGDRLQPGDGARQHDRWQSVLRRRPGSARRRGGGGRQRGGSAG